MKKTHQTDLIFKYLHIEKLRKYNIHLSLTPKNLFLFFSAYIILLFIINLFLVLFEQFPSERIEFLKKFLFSFSISFLPCTVSKVSSYAPGTDAVCIPDSGLILLYIYFAALSFLLVFNKKLKFFHWMIGFVFFNLIAGVFIVLKAYLYLNI